MSKVHGSGSIPKMFKAQPITKDRRAYVQQIFDAAVAVLEHAVECKGDQCEKPTFCQRMKNLEEHFRAQQISTFQWHCRACTSYFVIVGDHAKKCSNQKCRVHLCKYFKKKAMQHRAGKCSCHKKSQN
ncbi:hypothetical protein L596_024241 [Steinernema carpocapsae]|uniref:TAZ-type domain-containing protein n=1 Tax=Steinernema carpocapsae TaxID=34508 RepID=A0A4U5MG62_STECR|nr:hypothetical protein L596_024241 [Steinernema carpocapsae]